MTHRLGFGARLPGGEWCPGDLSAAGSGLPAAARGLCSSPTGRGGRGSKGDLEGTLFLC